MKIFLFLAAIPLAFSENSIGFGTLHISMIDNSPIQGPLAITNDLLSVGDTTEVFDYYSGAGALLSLRTKKFLSVSKTGRLILKVQPRTGFFVGEKAASDGKRRLFYRENAQFQLCGDGSIAVFSTCEGARNITIIYEDYV
ncbi:hypothetical protein JCM33374_g1748 [Metschnikowia sp. JCM 33374]|nr:hypothetical protein JCM33374_g1748 [Metschnikowia sp. JCM 33374]